MINPRNLLKNKSGANAATAIMFNRQTRSIISLICIRHPSINVFVHPPPIVFRGDELGSERALALAWPGQSHRHCDEGRLN